MDKAYNYMVKLKDLFLSGFFFGMFITLLTDGIISRSLFRIFLSLLTIIGMYMYFVEAHNMMENILNTKDL